MLYQFFIIKLLQREEKIMTKVLEIENLKKFYGENCVLNNISLEIEENQFMD